MVNALHAVHDSLVRGGLAIDARPDSALRRVPRIEHAGVVIGYLDTAAEAAGDDESANEAVARAIADGLFEVVESGHYWFAMRFGTRAELESYLRSSSRFSSHRWRARVRSQLRTWQGDPMTIRRSVQFAVLRAKA